MGVDKLAETISEMSVDCAKHLQGNYETNIIECFTFAGKYISIAALRKEDRSDISKFTGADKCPLCLFHKSNKCYGCVLHDRTVPGCGSDYTYLLSSITKGTYMDISYNVGNILREILK